MKSLTVSIFVILFAITLTLGGYLIYNQANTLKEYRSDLSVLSSKNLTLERSYEEVLGESSNVSVSVNGVSSKTNLIADVITEYTRVIDGDVSVYYKNLTTDETVLVSGEKEYYMASLYKLIVTLFVLQQEKEGKLHFTDEIGSPPLTIEEALTRIITESNNEYAQAIAKKYGWEEIESVMRSRLGIPFRFDSSLETNALSIGTLLTDVSQSIRINDTESSYMLALMNKQQRTGKLPKYLPKNIYSHNKTGEFEQFSHDAGIFYTPKANYVLVFMSKTGSPGVTDEKMAQMSEVIYKTLNDK